MIIITTPPAHATPASSPESPPLIEGNAVRKYMENVISTCIPVQKVLRLNFISLEFKKTESPFL